MRKYKCTSVMPSGQGYVIQMVCPEFNQALHLLSQKQDEFKLDHEYTLEFKEVPKESK